MSVSNIVTQGDPPATKAASEPGRSKARKAHFQTDEKKIAHLHEAAQREFHTGNIDSKNSTSVLKMIFNFMLKTTNDFKDFIVDQEEASLAWISAATSFGRAMDSLRDMVQPFMEQISDDKGELKTEAAEFVSNIESAIKYNSQSILESLDGVFGLKIEEGNPLSSLTALANTRFSKSLGQLIQTESQASIVDGFETSMLKAKYDAFSTSVVENGIRYSDISFKSPEGFSIELAPTNQGEANAIIVTNNSTSARERVQLTHGTKNLSVENGSEAFEFMGKIIEEDPDHTSISLTSNTSIGLDLYRVLAAVEKLNTMAIAA